MTESKHTQLPWEVSSTGLLTNEGQRAIMAPDPEMGKKRVALVDLQTRVKRGKEWQSECAERDANAAYIVQACNAYPKLVEALKAIVTEYDSDSATNQHLWTLIDKNARETLREAGEEL